MRLTNRRFVVLIIIGIIMGSLAFSYLVSMRQYDYAKSELIDKSRIMAREVMATRQFLAENQDRINRDSHNNFEFKGLNPARGIFLISQNFDGNWGYSIKQASFPATVRNPQNMPDRWELDALNKFKSSSRLAEYYGEVSENGNKFFRYATPLYVDSSCLPCHGEPAGQKDVAGFAKEGYHLGDLRGIVSITVPMAKFDATFHTMAYKLLAGGVLMGIFLSLSLVLILHFTFVKPAQKQLIRASQLAAAGHVTAAAAHEINNPLSIISSRAELILEEGDISEQVKEDVEVIRQSADRVTGYMHGLLSLARPRVSGKPEKIMINQLLDESVFLLEKQLEKSGIILKREYAEPSPLIWGRGESLKQVFFNLLANAQDALTKGGVITLRTGQRENQVSIDIIDNGKGISPQDLKHIFDPFFTTKKAQGTGLGLSISQKLVHENHGRIEVQSTLEQGTHFKILLPAYLSESGKH